MPRIIAMLIWGLLILIGVLIIVIVPGEKATPGPIAARFLPRNRQTRSDLGERSATM